MLPSRPSRHRSLRRRLPLFLVGLTAAALLLGGLVAWDEVRSAARAAGEERVSRTTRELAERIRDGQLVRDSLVEEVASRPSVRAALAGRVDSVALRRELDRLRRNADGQLPVQLWSRQGERLLSVGVSPAADTVVGPEFGEETVYGPFRRLGQRTLYWVTYPIGSGDRISGWIAQRQRLGSPQTAATLATLLGDSLTLVVGHQEHDTWSTFDGTLIPPPAARHPLDSVFTTSTVDGSPALALAAELEGTPWVLMSLLPVAAMDVRPRAFVSRMLRVGIVLLLVVAAMGVWAGRRLAAPIEGLASAADRIAAGRYDERLEPEGDDELARTAEAFNSMATQVARSDERLRRQLEEARALATSLEQANAGAERAREEAQAASRAKSEFLATMSHEIRTPINAVIGYTELLAQGIPDEPTPGQLAYFERIERSSRLLIALVNDVLDLARIESGRLAVRGGSGSVADAVSSALSALEPQSMQKGVALLSECESGLWFGGDPDRVQQILLDLVSNAVKFTPAGGTVRVASRAAPEGPPELPRADGWIRADVVDSGIGISRAQLESIFEPFVQADGGLAREHGGAGLGLAISLRLARMLGGTITVESTEGAGSRFTLWLPRAPRPSGSAGDAGESRSDTPRVAVS